MSIKLKLQLIVLLSVAVTAISLVIVSSTALKNLSKKNIEVYEEDITQSKINSIKDATQFATRVVQSYYDRIDDYGNSFLKEKTEQLLNSLNYAYEKNKENLSEDEMKKLLKTIAEGSRYGKSGYFWINDFNYKMIMHPIKKELTGKYFRNNPKIPFVKIGVQF